MCFTILFPFIYFVSRPFSPIIVLFLYLSCVVHIHRVYYHVILIALYYFSPPTQMVKDFNVTPDPNKIGYYVGYISSSFAVAQFFTGESYEFFFFFFIRIFPNFFFFFWRSSNGLTLLFCFC